MNAVPWGAMTFLTPASNAVIRSICPSQTMAESSSISSRLVRCRPKSTLPLVNNGVSGELTYFAPWASPLSTRPLKAITFPASSQIGNMSRSRNRS